jgi:hypothetical protein
MIAGASAERQGRLEMSKLTIGSTDREASPEYSNTIGASTFELYETLNIPWRISHRKEGIVIGVAQLQRLGRQTVHHLQIT